MLFTLLTILGVDSAERDTLDDAGASIYLDEVAAARAEICGANV